MECFDLFVKPAEDSGVAAFQANNLFSFARGLHHERVDFSLRDPFCTAALANIDQNGTRPGQGDDCGTDEIIMQNQVGLPEKTMRLNRQKLRLTGACSHERHFSWHGHACAVASHGVLPEVLLADCCDSPGSPLASRCSARLRASEAGYDARISRRIWPIAPNQSPRC